MRALESVYRVDGYSLDRYVKRLKEKLFIGTSEQDSALQEHLEYCCRSVPMYRNIRLRKTSGVENLKRFPIFDKALTRKDLSPAVAGRHGGRVRVDSTSGTSGETFRFLVSAREIAIRHAYERIANDWLGLPWGTTHLQIWGGHESKNIVKRIKAKCYGIAAKRELLVVPGVGQQTINLCAKRVCAHAGGVLITYPSILRELCTAADLVPVLRTYRSIILSGEAVDYRLFQEYNLTNLKNRYGCREFGVIAVADSGSLRYFQSRFVIENDDNVGLLITDLERKAMPLVRYPIGDFASVGISIPNTDVDIDRLFLLGRVDGRMFDVLEGRSGTRYVGTTWTLLMRDLGVSKFRIVCSKPHSLTVAITGSRDPNWVAESLRKTIGDDFDIRVIARPAIPELCNAKQKIVEICD